MVSYIKNGWVGSSRALFVSSRAPHKPFKNSQMLGTILRNAFKKIGLKPPHKFIGSHLFRHSLATDMLRKDIAGRGQRRFAASVAADYNDLRQVRH